MAKNIFLVVLLIIILVFVYQIFLNHPPMDTIQIDIKSQPFKLEVAKTIPQKTLGLGKRISLCKNCGMVFIWEFEMPLSFWMKDTLIPLDIIFLDKNRQVINYVTADPEPGVSDIKLKIYSSSSPAKYVIELNAGTAQKIGLVPGDKIDIKNN